MNSGSSKDWAYGYFGIPYSYVIELGPDDDSDYGFILPQRKLPGVATTGYTGIKAFFVSII